MNNKYIGVFDSGLGGLTSVREIMKIMPNENIVYFGDTGRVPYGTRSNETIIKYTIDDVRFLLKQDIKIIVSACGTASSVALPTVAPMFDIPIIGVVEPAALKAISVTKNKKIGVLGTVGTIGSGKYEQLIKSYMHDAEVFPKACPLFVPLVENGHINDKVAHLVAQEYLLPLKKEGVDTIVLGCTHYPLLYDVISDIMGLNVKLVDSGAETAKKIKELLTLDDNLATAPKEQQYKFFVSDSPESFIHLGGIFLQTDLNFNVQKVDVAD